MDTYEVITTRRSVREYQQKPIAREVLERIIDAGRFAPTARGEEPWEFVVVTEPATLARLGELAEHGRFIARAAACVAVFCRATKYYLEDGCAATQNIMLQARAEGVASCWVAGDKKPYGEPAATLLQMPAGSRLVSLISLGYPLTADVLSVKTKRPLTEVLHWNVF